MNNLYYYKGANPTVDLVLISPQDKILLVLRGKFSSACPHMWALPGGFINTKAKKNEVWLAGDELPETAAFREAVEETGIEAKLLDTTRLQFNSIYEGENRDPRDNDVSWSKSHAFFYCMNYDEKDIVNTVKGINDNYDLDDAEDTGWFSFEEISKMELAFDHNKIVEDTLIKVDNLKKIKNSIKKPT